MNRRTITENALIKRINRKLAPDGKKLRTARSMSVELAVGRYFIFDIYRNFIEVPNIDIEAEGRKLGVLQTREELGGVSVRETRPQIYTFIAGCE
jgi:hypothetical protein